MKLEEILNIERLKFQHSTNFMVKSLGGLPSPNVHFGGEKIAITADVLVRNHFKIKLNQIMPLQLIYNRVTVERSCIITTGNSVKVRFKSSGNVSDYRSIRCKQLQLHLGANHES